MFVAKSCLTHSSPGYICLLSLITSYKLLPTKGIMELLRELLVWVTRSGFLYFFICVNLYSSSFPLSCCCSVTQSCLTLCNPMDCSTIGLPIFNCLPEFAQTHVHWVGDAIQASQPLSSPSPPTLSLSQHQDLFQWISSLYHVAKVLELQLQHTF